MEQFYRPAAASTARAKVAQESVSERSGARRLVEQASGEGLDREEEAFLRARRRVPVRRGLIPTSRVGRITAAAAVVLAIAALVLLAIGVRNFFRDDPRFRIGSASSIQIMGNSQVTRSELLSVFGSDLGRNIFDGSSDLVTRSGPRKPDPFDLPPPTGGAAPAPPAGSGAQPVANEAGVTPGD